MASGTRSRDNAFAALDLDRDGDFRDDAAWLAERAHSPAARYLLLREDGYALLAPDRYSLHLLSYSERTRLTLERAPTLLGSAGGQDYFLLDIDTTTGERVAGTTGAGFVDLRSAGASLSAFDAGLFAYARGLAYWQQRTRYCAACGAPLRLESAGHRGRCTNPQCGIEHFPRTDPAIIVIVGDGDRCLLGRGLQWPERRYSTLAGFVEPGETLEDAVRREVFEEAGVRVGECDYHSSQPWPFPASLMLGFTAQAQESTIRLGTELAEARWFSVDELVAGLASHTLSLSSPLSVSYRLIEHWLHQTAGLELAALTGTDAPLVTPRAKHC